MAQVSASDSDRDSVLIRWQRMTCAASASSDDEGGVVTAGASADSAYA